uniref:Uncharacterized protein n=1 Tax=Thermosporothrix sp. COM3 TaxID=2490863 RepID=A0A455STM0_9CHLR|nr:hypothetical protein KTC_65240 [Thermosporothrix sp. COM3]
MTASSAPLLIHRQTVVLSTLKMFATSPTVKSSSCFWLMLVSPLLLDDLFDLGVKTV